MKTLRKGDRGDEVKTLQGLLGVVADGIFGVLTEAAVRSFQKQKGLAVDGVVGSKTWEQLRITNDELREAGVIRNSELVITKGYISTHITKCPGRNITYIAIHYTAGASSRKGAAMAVREVFRQRRASADFVVDDEEIVQINPDLRNYYCWAVGDRKNGYTGGGRLYGKATNKNTISIEICSTLAGGASASVPNHVGWTFTEAALENAKRLVRRLMKEYRVPKDCVVRHYDVSGKMCPGVLGWNDGQMYSADGKPIKGALNNSREWREFLSGL